MIKRPSHLARKRRGPGKKELAFVALKGAGMGTLIALIFVKFLP